jgi:hypothetical protein
MGLAWDYPMAAPNYSENRSAFARRDRATAPQARKTGGLTTGLARWPATPVAVRALVVRAPRVRRPPAALLCQAA